MSKQKNAERTVKCPVEGCGAEKLARGIHLHVRQSDGGGHGEQGEVPEGVDLDDLETAGSQAVSMDYPETRETEEAHRRCPYCHEVFQGKRGVMIHLGRTANTGPHPANPKEEVDSAELSLVRLGEKGEVVEVIDPSTLLPATRRRREREKQQSIEKKVRAVIKEFRQEGRNEAADRLEEILADV